MGRTEANLWQVTAGDPPEAAALSGDRNADLVIIGGGFTGCSAALHAAEAGLDVCLLEAETFGHGGSGRNVGLVNAGLWLAPETIAAKIGREPSERLNSALAAGPELVYELIGRHDIACEAVRAGTLHCAHSRAGLADLTDRHRQLLEQGAPVSLLSGEEAARRTGAAGYHGALHDARAGTVQPLAYCYGLARAAMAAGAALHPHSPALRIERSGGDWLVHASKGRVRAKALLIATNIYHQPLDGLDSPQTIPLCYFQMATRPLEGEPGRSVLPGGEGCWDTALILSSFRRDQAGRLIIGGIGSLEDFGAGVHRAWAARKLRTLFPQLAGQAFDQAWFGRIAMTSDHLPKVLRMGPDAYAIFGYSGRGIAPGTVFGRAAARMFAGGDETAFPLSPQDSHRESLTAVKGAYYEFGASLTHLVSARR